MRIDDLFSTFVDRSLERVPLLEVRGPTICDGARGRFAATISHNIFTEFDACLSQHLAAVRRGGLPGITVATRFVAEGSPDWTNRPAQHYDTIPHALLAIARSALQGGNSVKLRIAEWPWETGGVQEREVGPEDIHALEQALDAAKAFGPPEFSPVSGDFDLLVLDPPGGHGKVSIDMFKGTVSVPTEDDRIEIPMFGFVSHVNKNPELRSVLARIRHAQMETRQHAVLAFRTMAEQRIIRFNAALAGAPLEYHRLDAAMSLVARLKAGLGDDLRGLSEDAQITALDWSAAIDREEGQRSDKRKPRMATVTPLEHANA